MCVNPRFTDAGVRITCRKCWQCLANYADLWVGKCIAESRTAAKTYLVTLTYGSEERMGMEGNDMHAVSLNYPDVQLWLKRLRYQTTGPIRFLAAGEYGSAKGRAHWHVILFCQDIDTVIPNLKLNWRYVHEGERGQLIWPHGVSYWEELNAPAQIAYVCKYIQKDDNDTVYNTHVSKRPALGTEYFKYCAKLHVEQGLSPRDTFYGFPDVLKTHGAQKGTPRRYVMTTAAAYKYCQDFVTLWRDKWGDQPWPQSDLIDQYFDALAKINDRATSENLEGRLIELVSRFRAEKVERNVFTWRTTTDVNGKEEPTGATPLFLPFPVLTDTYLAQSRGLVSTPRHLTHSRQPIHHV